jgi:hypothetical protein
MSALCVTRLERRRRSRTCCWRKRGSMIAAVERETDRRALSPRAQSCSRRPACVRTICCSIFGPAKTVLRHFSEAMSNWRSCVPFGADELSTDKTKEEISGRQTISAESALQSGSAKAHKPPDLGFLRSACQLNDSWTSLLGLIRCAAAATFLPSVAVGRIAAQELPRPGLARQILRVSVGSRVSPIRTWVGNFFIAGHRSIVRSIPPKCHVRNHREQ